MSPKKKKESGMPLLAQVAEDWLFAYENAQSSAARETMWPNLVEAVEELIDATKRISTQQATDESAMPDPS